MFKTIKFLVLTIIASYSINCIATEECPLSLSATTQKLNVDVPGWAVAETKDKHVLVEVAIFDGPVEDLQGVMPEGEKRFKKDGKDFYSIHWNLEQPEGVQYWIRCGYAGTKVALTRKIVGSKVHCEAASAVFNGNVAPMISSAKCEGK